MRQLLNYIDKNLLFKIASLNSVAVITRVVVGFATSKAIAYYVGPSGMALIGNLRDFMGSARSFSTLGFYNGIVKYVSEYKNDIQRLNNTVSTVILSVIVTSLFLSTILFIFSNEINNLIFEHYYNYSFIIKLLALALPFYALNMVLMAVINGTSKFKFLLNVSIIGHVITAIITLLLIWQHKLIGALIAVVVSELAVLIIILLGIKKPQNLYGNFRLSRFNLSIFKNLGSYSAMALFTAATLPLTYVFIRNYISETIGLSDAGYWEAMNRI